MSIIRYLSADLAHTKAWSAIAAAFAENIDAAVSTPAAVRPLLASAIADGFGGPILCVVAGEEGAARFANTAAAFLGAERVLRYPEAKVLPWIPDSRDIEGVGMRARALNALATGRSVLVVASARSLLRAVAPQGSQVFDPLALKVDDEHDMAEISTRLARMGYDRVEAASARGEFTIRGGVLDIYPSDLPYPVRAEFFGDQIESLRRFVPGTGQSIGEIDSAEIFCAREVALSGRAVERATRALASRAALSPVVTEHLELMQAGIYFNGIERYLPFLYESAGAATDYVPAAGSLIVVEPVSLFTDATKRYEEIAALARFARVNPDELYLRPSGLDLSSRRKVTMLSLMSGQGVIDARLEASRPELSTRREGFAEGMRALVERDLAIVMAASDRETRERITEELTEAGISFADIGSSTDGSGGTEGGASGTPLQRRVVHLAPIEIPAGFVMPESHLALIATDDVFPRAAAAKQRARKAESARITFTFAPGDYVVHSAHGIALFSQMERKEVMGIERDYLVLIYAKGDKLYVPVEQIHKITKYVGAEGHSPKVTRLNTTDWSKATTKARKAARKLAFDLVDLYARRAAVQGHAFAPDTPWQVEMESAFPYIETPDQLAAIADVKADMESQRPMDRLICGDVGYGKTEVAIRAAFKAAQEGKQVMILCPTTILAQQHFTTFSERFAPFGVRVEVLSRFRTPAQQRASIDGFAKGEVEVLIGTHRLLSRDVSPRSLGMVIIDEEQRFGVEHKEYLKNLREQVDILAMSATPIPRTLQMSLSGVRDMSVIDTAPSNRHPVQVYAGQWDENLVASAIRKELDRHGQVYYVSNRVRSIDDALARVHRAAPDARIGVAHGKMNEKQLESVMEAFSANEYDVLVATTIIESGIDNPHSNTLIIEDSQRLGLSQLYQLKGRVGRSHVRAFAYFLFPSADALTEQAAERLTAIRDNSELGGGIRVAMRDLEIRGAGNLVGPEQSGNMSAVGFDLFVDMLHEAVMEAKGEESAVPTSEVTIDLAVPAYLPEEYAPRMPERVRFYRRIASAADLGEIEAIEIEIAEALGPLPEPARNLLDVARVKALATEAGIESVSLEREKVVMGPLSLTDDQKARVVALRALYFAKQGTVAIPAKCEGSVMRTTLKCLGAILGSIV